MHKVYCLLQWQIFTIAHTVLAKKNVDGQTISTFKTMLKKDSISDL